MSAKRGFFEVKSKLYRSLFLSRSVRFHDHPQQKYNRLFTNCKVFNCIGKTCSSSAKGCAPGVTGNLSFIDTGQRNLHTALISKSEKVTALEQEDHVNLSIEPPVPHDVVMAQLKNCMTVADQMAMLRTTLSLTKEDVEKRMSICADIKNMLEPFFEDFKVQLYGSSVNGYGFKGSDIDMSFKVNVEFENVMSQSFDDSEIPAWEEVMKGNVSRKYISQMSPRDQLLFIHFVFLDFYKESSAAPLFINAYIPIVRFVNDKYNVKCDLSCGNRTASGNTKLLYIFGSIDERVIPLIMTIRYWAKHVGLIGNGLMFNTYTMTLMVMFFLQTRNPPVLPPAEDIVSMSDAIKSPDMYDKIILKDIEKIPRSKNTESLEELFREFFFYYLYFDFTQVICPLNATSVDRNVFCANIENSKKFRMNTICVQDPIKLTHNVANLVDYRHCRKFGKEMLTACKLLQDKTFWSPSTDDWGLVSLMDNKEMEHIYADETVMNFKVPLKLSSSQYSEMEGDALLQKASNLVLKILHKALLFECEAVQQSTDTAWSHDGSRLQFSAKCQGSHNTWLGRNSAKSDVVVSNDLLEQEHITSLKLCNRESDRKREYAFYCKGYAIKHNNQLALHIKLSPAGKIEFSPVLGIFLKDFIPRTMDSLL